MRHIHKEVLVRFGKAWAANCRCGREGQTVYATRAAALAGYRGIRCG